MFGMLDVNLLNTLMQILDIIECQRFHLDRQYQYKLKFMTRSLHSGHKLDRQIVGIISTGFNRTKLYQL
jgi:hypothetical protein